MKTHKTKPSHFKQLIASLGMACLALIGTAKAEEYTIHFSDPVGDNYAPYFDVTGMDFSFDTETGEYVGRFFTTDSSPFQLSSGSYNFNLSLINVRRQAAGLEQFEVNQSGWGTLVSRTVLEFRGVNSALTTWLPGDQIAPSQSDLIGQSGIFPTLYTPWSSPAYFLGAALVIMDPMWINQAAIVQVPEPSSLALGGVGLAAFLAYRRLRTSVRPK